MDALTEAASSQSAASGETVGGNSNALPIVSVLPSSAHAWLASLIAAVIAAAAPEAPRAPFGGRSWHERRTVRVAEALPPCDASAELPCLFPAELAIVHVENASSKDAQALRATGSPPSGVSAEQAAKLLFSGACDERLVFTGLCNMFMQSGVPGAMGYDLIDIPPNGLCVWLVVALLSARRDAPLCGLRSPQTHAKQFVGVRAISCTDLSDLWPTIRLATVLAGTRSRASSTV